MGVQVLEAAWPLTLSDHTQSTGALRAASEPTAQNSVQMVCASQNREGLRSGHCTF